MVRYHKSKQSSGGNREEQGKIAACLHPEMAIPMRAIKVKGLPVPLEDMHDLPVVVLGREKEDEIFHVFSRFHDLAHVFGKDIGDVDGFELHVLW